jgi:hypothetical protein
MKKAILLFGEISTLAIAEKIAQLIAKDLGESVSYDASYLIDQNDDNFSFYECSDDTKAIIIKECPENFNFELFFTHITNGIKIEKRLYEPNQIYPKFIFVSQHKPKLLSASFKARFQFIEIT